MFNVKNKKFIVAGASGLIGRAIVRELLNNKAHVVAIDRDIGVFESDSSLSCSSELTAVCLDIGSEESLVNFFSRSIADGIVYDGAVNLAYPRNSNYGRQFLDVELSDFVENTSSHLGCYFNFMKECIKYSMAGGNDFSLVNFSSIYGSKPPRFSIYENTKMTMPVEYAAVKSGIEHITRYAVAYLKGRSINFRVNCVSPGGIEANQHDSFLTAYAAYCSSKGMLSPNDIVGAVLFLLSDNSRYISGQNLIVDDGFSV